MRKPKGRAASTAAVAIDGADSQGKANDKEVCGDAAAVSRRRSERYSKVKVVPYFWV